MFQIFIFQKDPQKRKKQKGWDLDQCVKNTGRENGLKLLNKKKRDANGVDSGSE